MDQVQEGTVGNGGARSGNARWRRRTEERCGAKSVFHFDVPGSVAKSTHAGLPWLRFLQRELASQLHCWPFDGWQPGPGRSVLAESYPALWSHEYPAQHRNSHQHDAYTIARWFREQDLAGTLATAFHPKLDATERSIAAIEGWILGLPGIVVQPTH
ncbi:MAG: hypothetical protein JNL10_06415 [Verrucomicrobiales bacterium]|nr:hypothetical protein [Verrucomicrobiales bacterium]